MNLKMRTIGKKLLGNLLISVVFLNVVSCGSIEDSMVSQEQSEVIIEEELESEELEEELEADDSEELEVGDIEGDEGNEEIESLDEVISAQSSTSNSSASNSVSSGSSTSSNNSSNSSTSSSSLSGSSTTTHTCNYNIPIIQKIAEVGHYETVTITAAWTETVPIIERVCTSVCNVCGERFYEGENDKMSAHMKAHALAGEGGSSRTEYIDMQTGTETITHPAVTEQKYVIDTPASEKIIGYECSCGKTK